MGLMSTISILRMFSIWWKNTQIINPGFINPMLTKKAINNGVFGGSAGFFEIEPIYIK